MIHWEILFFLPLKSDPYSYLLDSRHSEVPIESCITMLPWHFGLHVSRDLETRRGVTVWQE